MKKKLFIAGDSTAAQKSGEAKPETGWGEKISCFLSSDIEVRNYAQNGRSTKSFIAEKRLDQISNEIGPGDFLLVQFGHNDQKIDLPIGTMPYGDYQENLARFVEVARAKNAFPVLLTSVTRRDNLPDGRLNPETLGDYPAAMIALGEKLAVPALDVYRLTQDYYEKMGMEETKKLHLHLAAGQHPNYPAGVTDNTHFNDYGAYQIARIIAAAIRETEHPLSEYVR